MAKIDDAILTLDELNISVETDDPKNVPDIDDGIYKRSYKEIPGAKKRKVSNGPEVLEDDSEEKKGAVAARDSYSAKGSAGSSSGGGDVQEDDEDGDATTFLSEQEGEDPVLRDVTTGEQYVIDKNPFSIGKLRSNDLIIDDSVISRHHAEIVQFGDKIFIRDLKSLNGTFVGGYRVPPETDFELKPGQQIVFANKKYAIKW